MSAYQVSRNPLKHTPKQKYWILGAVNPLINRIERRRHMREWQVDICSGTPDKCIDHRRAFGTNNNNWGNLLQAILGTCTVVGEDTFIVCTSANSGTNVSVRTQHTTTVSTYTFNNESGCGSASKLTAYIQLGTGNGTPARSDSNLFTPQSPVSEPDVTSTFVNGASQVTLTATCTYASAISPTEVGIFMYMITTAGTPDTFMLDHTSFSALASNTAFTVTYSVALG